jgi:hypothetical protein
VAGGAPGTKQTPHSRHRRPALAPRVLRTSQSASTEPPAARIVRCDPAGAGSDARTEGRSGVAARRSVSGAHQRYPERPHRLPGPCAACGEPTDPNETGRRSPPHILANSPGRGPERHCDRSDGATGPPGGAGVTESKIRVAPFGQALWTQCAHTRIRRPPASERNRSGGRRPSWPPATLFSKHTATVSAPSGSTRGHGPVCDADRRPSAEYPVLDVTELRESAGRRRRVRLEPESLSICRRPGHGGLTHDQLAS